LVVRQIVDQRLTWKWGAGAAGSAQAHFEAISDSLLDSYVFCVPPAILAYRQMVREPDQGIPPRAGCRFPQVHP
jgi:hypothetical protein